MPAPESPAPAPPASPAPASPAPAPPAAGPGAIPDPGAPAVARNAVTTAMRCSGRLSVSRCMPSDPVRLTLQVRFRVASMRSRGASRLAPSTSPRAVRRLPVAPGAADPGGTGAVALFSTRDTTSCVLSRAPRTSRHVSAAAPARVAIPTGTARLVPSRTLLLARTVVAVFLSLSAFSCRACSSAASRAAWRSSSGASSGRATGCGSTGFMSRSRARSRSFASRTDSPSDSTRKSTGFDEPCRSAARARTTRSVVRRSTTAFAVTTCSRRMMCDSSAGASATDRSPRSASIRSPVATSSTPSANRCVVVVGVSTGATVCSVRSVRVRRICCDIVPLLPRSRLVPRGAALYRPRVPVPVGLLQCYCTRAGCANMFDAHRPARARSCCCCCRWKGLIRG
ncbi:hypothetical protein CXF47_10215 [Corynebacterium bovis]|nr:hypothetical protein CXF47_10215 [Corynebacterium bovis]